MKPVLLALLFFLAGTASAQTSAAPQSSTPPTPPPVASNEPDIELNTVMMESTFKIEGPAAQGGTSLGTVFMIGLPVPNSTPPSARLVMITAAHVLEEMQGDFANLHLRREVDNQKNVWVEVPFQLRIRANGSPLWKRNPQADVAVMYLSVPAETPIKPITTLMFVDDAKLAEYGVNPGDEVRSLGYPLGLSSNEAGFPVLRSGKIASYPLTPTDQTKTFLVDFRVFKGNSGGPVYFVERNRPIVGVLGRYETFHFIMGLVSQEALYNETMLGQYSQESHQTQLGLAIVVHASLILQTLQLLPPPQ
jgi:S1-C subfamily serine protease